MIAHLRVAPECMQPTRHVEILKQLFGSDFSREVAPSVRLLGTIKTAKPSELIFQNNVYFLSRCNEAHIFELDNQNVHHETYFPTASLNQSCQ